MRLIECGAEDFRYGMFQNLSLMVESRTQPFAFSSAGAAIHGVVGVRPRFSSPAGRARR